MDQDRIRYWLGQGARPTDRVAVFLGKAQIIPMPERRGGSTGEVTDDAEGDDS